MTTLSLTGQTWELNDGRVLQTQEIFTGLLTKNIDRSLFCRNQEYQEWEALPIRFQLMKHYGLLKELGKGTFGRVFLAFDARPRGDGKAGRLVAIKEAISAKSDIAQLFSKEAMITARLAVCPYVVGVLDLDVSVPFMVLEFCDGGSLGGRIRKPYSIRDVAQWGYEISSALSIAHDLQPDRLVHRDLKPDNVLLSQGSIKISDFGTSQMVQSHESLRSLSGGFTPAYAAPEAFDGKAYPATDIWSLGVILYEVISGTQPFIASSSTQIFKKILLEEPSHLSEVDKLQTDPALIDLVHACLKKNPQDRPSASECVQTLSSWINPELLSNSPQQVSSNRAPATTPSRGTIDKQEETRRLLSLEMKRHAETRRLSSLDASLINQLPIDAQTTPHSGNFTSQNMDVLRTQSSQARGPREVTRQMQIQKRVKEKNRQAEEMFEAERKKEMERKLSQTKRLQKKDFTAPSSVPTPEKKENKASKAKANKAKAKKAKAKKSSSSGKKVYVFLFIFLLIGAGVIFIPKGQRKSSLPGFTYLEDKIYSCGGEINTVKEYRHDVTGMIFVLVPGGSFKMGSEANEGEQPVHQVKVKSFLISKYEVTQKAWGKVMPKKDTVYVGDDLPMAKVSWEECTMFCQKQQLKLPTEAQWEYACRAGTFSTFFWGEEMSDDYVWYSGNSKKISPVGQKKPNAFGLFDMLGNVQEWCLDKWKRNYEGVSENGDDPWLDSKGNLRILRGGAYLNPETTVRSAFRSGKDPGYKSLTTGFRVVKNLP